MVWCEELRRGVGESCPGEERLGADGGTAQVRSVKSRPAGQSYDTPRPGEDGGMGWLEWCQRKFPTYGWRREGCKLLPATEKAVDDLWWTLAAEEALGGWTPAGQGASIGGVNPHGDGKWSYERGRHIFDVPFWAAKWLVFDRDQRCQDCGIEQDYISAPRDGYHFDRPLTPQDNGYPIFRTKFEVHHIVPVVRGGSNCTHNLVLLCEPCHHRKKGKGGAVVPNTQLKLPRG